MNLAETWEWIRQFPPRSSSPLTVCFRSLVARQTPHIFHFETGRFVGAPCQRWQPLQGHEGEKSCIVHRMLMSGGEKEQFGSDQSSRRYVLCLRAVWPWTREENWENLYSLWPNRRWITRLCLNSSLHVPLRTLREQWKSSVALYQSACKKFSRLWEKDKSILIKTSLTVTWVQKATLQTYYSFKTHTKALVCSLCLFWLHNNMLQFLHFPHR